MVVAGPTGTRASNILAPMTENEDERIAGEALPYLVSRGWIESRRTKRSVDAEGRPLPWITYGAIDFLTERARETFTVFEFGSGNSTLWWAERVAHVTSVEHDEKWAQRVARRLPGNVTYSYVPLERDGDYCRAASASGETFDIVVVDGRDRVNCAGRRDRLGQHGAQPLPAGGRSPDRAGIPSPALPGLEPDQRGRDRDERLLPD
jgi:hypothetical protein